MFKDYLIAKGAALKGALGKARGFLAKKLLPLLQRDLDGATLAGIEQLLLEADFGAKFTSEVLQRTRRDARQFAQAPNRMVWLKSAILDVAQDEAFAPWDFGNQVPWTAMMVGINGHGKTTTSAKLANFCQRRERTTSLVAADTFRAAGAEQLIEWAHRLEVPHISGARGADPASVIFDGLQSAVAGRHQTCIIDTAGRLHTHRDLMQQLQKMRRVCAKVVEGAPHEIFLVVEAPTGQNALQQARVFAEHLPITGIILTKLDGSAKGGIALALQKECKLPVRFIGTGEGIEDLQIFELAPFIEALFEN